MLYESEEAVVGDKQTSYLQRYIDGPKLLENLYKRTLLIVVISQIFGGAGFAAGVTVGALIIQEMLGLDSTAGIPVALLTLGSAGAALIIGRLSQHFGRRAGLVAGYFTGGLGAVGVVSATVHHSLILLFLSLVIYGTGTATNMLARYAGTDLAKPTQRATAVSMAMVSTTFGAVAGPNLVGVMGQFALTRGIPALAGPFLLAAAAFILAGLALLVFLRPDPYLVANAVANAEKTKPKIVSDDRLRRLNSRGIIAGTSIMIVTQVVMTSIMTMTPVYMKHHGHGLGEVGFVIGIHVGAMYLPSLISGILVDKIGRVTMSVVSGVILITAGLTAAFVPGDSLISVTIALAILGLGWNFGFISGTAIIIDAAPLSTRAKTQGTVDVLIALTGASGAAVSGVIAAYASFAALSLWGSFFSLLLIPVVIWYISGTQVLKT